MRDEKEIGVTRLLFMANLSHDRLTAYLKELIGKEWLVENEVAGRRAWRLSEQGRSVLLEIERVNRFMEDFGLEL